jgi:hypothetical protein
VSPPIPEYPTWWEAAKTGGGKRQPGKAKRAVNALLRVGGVSTAKTLHAARA